MTTQIFSQIITKIIRSLGAEINAEVSLTTDLSHGDYTTNVALAAARVLKRNPIKIAGEIVSELKVRSSKIEVEGVEHITHRSGQNISFTQAEKSVLRDIDHIEIAPPGFINLHVSASTLINSLHGVLKEPQTAGTSQNMKGKKVMVEYTDPNPFKELHIGHLYSNAVGESLARLFASQGAIVKRADYFGDVGMHVAKSIWGLLKLFKSESVQLADLEKQPLPERVHFLARAYAAGAQAYETDTQAKEDMKDINYLVYVSAQEYMRKSLNWQPVVNYRRYIGGNKYDLTEISHIYEMGRQWSMDYFRQIFTRLGTKFDFYYPESLAGEYGTEIVREHIGKVFEESDGAVVFRGEKHGLHTRVFINSLGLPTYEAKELGLAPTKYADFAYDLSVIATGNEINEYFRVLMAALGEINAELAAKTRHIGHGMVQNPDGSKMSSRSGKALTGEGLIAEAKQAVYDLINKNESKYTKEEQEDIAEKAAIAAVKYSFLKVTLPGNIAFDIDKSVSFEGDSGPYIQYTYARAKSVIRKSAQDSQIYSSIPAKSGEKSDASLTPEELTLLRLIYRFPEVVAQAAAESAPSRLVKYVYDLAAAFNLFYNKHPILDSANAAFRLELTRGAAAVLQKCLYLLGIATLERM